MQSDDEEFAPLLPAGLHITTLDGLEELCVAGDRFKKSITRSALLDAIRHVVAKCNAAGIAGMIWVNGSFLTEKLNPQDVDLCLRIRHEVYDYGTREQIACIDWLTSQSLYASVGVDGYLLIEYPFNHEHFAIGVANLDYWKRQFGVSRKGLAKGIAVLELVKRNS